MTPAGRPSKYRPRHPLDTIANKGYCSVVLGTAASNQLPMTAVSVWCRPLALNRHMIIEYYRTRRSSGSSSNNSNIQVNKCSLFVTISDFHHTLERIATRTALAGAIQFYNSSLCNQPSRSNPMGCRPCACMCAIAMTQQQ